MIAIEAIALAEGRTLLTLDTWTGGHAEPLYRSLGYVTVGVIPRYARGSLTPDLEPRRSCTSTWRETWAIRESAAPCPARFSCWSALPESEAQSPATKRKGCSLLPRSSYNLDTRPR